MTERELGLEEMEDEEEEEREIEEEENVGEEDWLKEGSERGGVETSNLPLPVLANDKEGLRELRQLQEKDGSLSGKRNWAKEIKAMGIQRWCIDTDNL